MLFFGLRLSMFFSPVITSLSTFSSVPSWETHSYHGPLGLLWINLSGIFLNDRHKTRKSFILVHNEENKLKALGRSNNDNKSTETLYWYCFYPSKCIFWLNCCFKYWLLFFDWVACSVTGTVLETDGQSNLPILMRFVHGQLTPADIQWPFTSCLDLL